MPYLRLLLRIVFCRTGDGKGSHVDARSAILAEVLARPSSFVASPRGNSNEVGVHSLQRLHVRGRGDGHEPEQLGPGAQLHPEPGGPGRLERDRGFARHSAPAERRGGAAWKQAALAGQPRARTLQEVLSPGGGGQPGAMRGGPHG